MLLQLTDLQWLPEGGDQDPTCFALGATMYKEGKKEMEGTQLITEKRQTKQAATN